MASETSRTRTGRVTPEMLLASVDVLTEYLHEELDEFPEGEDIPEGHVAFHVSRLARWRNQAPEAGRPQTYNGWRNYETWLANLWQTNDNETYAHCQELARDAVSRFPADGEGVFTQREAAALHLAKVMKAESEPDDPGYCSFFGDLLAAALAEVCWFETALYFVDEATE